MKQTFCLLALAFSFACSSADLPARRSERAEVEVRSIDPAPGTQLTEASVLRAEIAYSITDFDPGAEYYLAAQFGTREPGVTFNSLDRIRDSRRLTSARGTVTIAHPIAREWRSGRLTEPIRVWFYLMVMTGKGKSLAVGQTPVTEYRGTAG